MDDDDGIVGSDARERYRLLVEHHPHAVLFTDAEGLVLEANPAAGALVGHSVGDMIGRHVEGLAEILDPAPARAVLERAEREGPQQLDLAIRATDTTSVDLRATVIPVTVDSRLTGALAVLEDVTDRRRLARELEMARAVASSAADVQSGFVARTSHEVRTPLTSIVAVSELLGETTDPHEQKRLLDTLGRASRRLLQLIDNVLDFAAGDTAVDTRASEVFDLHDVVHDAVSLVDATARRKGLEIQVALANDVPHRVRDHPTWMSQILVNLLSNAVAFTETGGVALDVSYSCTAPSRALVTFRITDTGVGIAPEDADRIFEPFASPVDGDGSPGGVGLGLNIVRQLVRMSGGTMVFSSTPGDGSVFTVVMPVEPVTG